MWFYNQESSEIETITYLETGVQIIRSGNEIWGRAILSRRWMKVMLILNTRLVEVEVR